MGNFRIIAAALLASSVLATSPPARAHTAPQTDAQTIAELKAQVEALTRRVSELERSSASSQQSSPAGTADQPASATSPISIAEARGDPLPSPTARASDVVAREVPPAPADRPLQGPGSAFQLSASSDSGEVSIRLGTTIADSTLDTDGRGQGRADTLSFTASAPIKKGEDSADLGTLDGFANSSALKVRWTRFIVPIAIPEMSPDPRIRARNAEIVETARRNCRTLAGGDAAKVKACNDAEENDEFIATYNEREADEYLALGFPGPSFAFGLEGSIGYKKFSYFDASTLAEESSEKVPLGAKAFLTWFPNASLTSLTGSLEYQRAFEEQKSAVMCPVSDEAPVRCVNGAIGAPDRKNSLLGALEYRRQFFFKDSWIPSIGIAPQITYDILQDKGGFDLPIYVVPDEKGNLLGGIRFGYRTDNDDLVIGVFVGSAFSFRP